MLTGFSVGNNVDGGYSFPVTIGNQTFQMLLDTGSPDLWVPSVNCTSKSCKKHKQFDEKISQNFINTEKKYSLLFNQKASFVNVTGAFENVEIGGIIAEKQQFGCAFLETDDFYNAPFDGILGLSLDKLSTQHIPTVFSTMVKQNKVEEPIFSIYLSRARDSGDKGALTLGGVDKEKFSGDIVNNKVIGESGFWVINLEGLSVDGKKIELDEVGNETKLEGKNELKKQRKSIIDTGTSLLKILYEDAEKIHANIGGFLVDFQGGGFAIPCNTTSVVSLQFNNIHYSIDPKDLIISNISSVYPGFCFSGIQGIRNQVSSVDGMGIWLIGDVFLKNVYSVFNTKEKTVGFAPSIHNHCKEVNKILFFNIELINVYFFCFLIRIVFF
ncbi:pepsin-like aspartic protease [endosymbiont GvMRE of Glomus versiforme]|uniref:pepsin-like aspartic protease n=1 Tax=endosymbiont GvMRE of Glomus versiforme TaxID=2039283 RepID=UPI001558D3CB|nr:pepsin-like aspartic protease [endosymbiont GvMRE of Glomus versiforme]